MNVLPKYVLRNKSTGEEWIGTVKGLRRYVDIDAEMLNMMVKYHFEHMGYTCDNYIPEKKDFINKRTTLNKDLDKLAMEARQHGMSYGMYVGILETFGEEYLCSER